MTFLRWGITCLLLCAGSLFGASFEDPQSSGTSGTLRGSVADPSSSAIPGASVIMQNPISHYTRAVTADAQGKFEFDNIPFNNYHVTVTSNGFQPAERDVEVRSPIAIELKFSLTLETGKTSVQVKAKSGDLVETDPFTHTDVDRDLFQRIPIESQSSSLSSLVTLVSPGVAADSNGLFHGMGDHAQNSFSVDGQPITDQQSKVFSNQIPVDSVQSTQIIEGAPPAEYGGKTSLVIVVTTRSGLGVDKPHGSVDFSYGSFGTSSGGFDLSFGSKTAGNFISANGLDTGRFLDTPEFGILHARGNQTNLFDRIDLQLSQNDTLNINLEFTRSWFQTPNSYDAQTAAAWSGGVVDNGGLGPNGQIVGSQDQRSQIRTFNVAPNWTRAIGGDKIFTFGGFLRQDQFNYYPSNNPFADLTPNLQNLTLGQNRRLTNMGVRTTGAYTKGIHDLKAGVVFQHTFLTERDSFGIVDPEFNPPGPNFNPLLACYDLTYTGTLPASFGCPSPTPTLYHFYGHADIKELGMYIEDAINEKNWTFNLGFRFDLYNGLTSQTQLQPRLGIAYNIKSSNTVLRVSYARTLETPFNENLVLSSEGCNDPVVNAIMSTIGPCLPAALGPSWRNEFHVGLQQGFGRFFVVDTEYIWKYTHRAYDFSVFAATPLTFPIEWERSKIPGFTARVTVPEQHRFTAFVVMSSVAARFFTPQIAGIGATPGGSTVFRIDHDERFNQTTHLQYQFGKVGPWVGFNWRYDSGLVAGPVPCAGGNCANGPNGTDTIVDVSNLSPDQQFQGGLFCGTVFATPTMPISPTGLCPASEYGSKFIRIPTAGTENDDHNPPRIAPRSLFDISVGHDNIFNGDPYKWSFRISVVNLTNNVALYNFLSTFSGTHYVTPRAINATVAFHF